MTTTTTSPTPEEPARGLRFTDPTADIVWAAIQTLDEAAKHEVLTHLRAHLDVPDARQTGKQAQVARAIFALREAAAIRQQLGHTGDLTSHAYELLRSEMDRKGDWPPESSIRRFVAGTWNDALRRAQLDPVADGDAIRVALGGRLTREEIIAAVRECAQDTSNRLPRFGDYIAWCHRPDVRRRPGRRPNSQAPFDRVFGRWGDVLVAAGLAADGEIQGPLLAVPDESTRSRGGYRWPDEMLEEAVRTIAGRLGRPPNTTEYPLERERLLAERAAQGLAAKPFPSLPTVLIRYRTWDAVLTAAGLDPEQANSRGRKGSAKRISDTAILGAVREGFDAVGHPFTVTAYETWRKRTTAKDRQAGVVRTIASYTVIHDRFGTWQKACQKALGQPRR